MKRFFWTGCIAVGCTSGAPKGDPVGGAQASTTADTAVTDAAADSAVPPVPPCAGRGTTVADLTAASCVTEAACTWDGTVSYAYRGYAVTGGGDFDGDGVDDLAIGTPYADVVVDGTAVYDGGEVAVLSGAGLTAGATGALGVVAGRTEGELSGSALHLVGDLDGDGDSELLIGARSYSEPGLPNLGAAHLVLGEASTPASPPVIHRTWTGGQMYGRVGSTVVSPGDLDGDGIPDLAIGGDLWESEGTEAVEVLSRGRVYLASGAAIPESGPITSFPVTLEGTGSLDQAGTALAGGDLNGDGYVDLVVGVPYGSSTKGAVVVIHGSADALSPTIAPLDTVASRTVEGAHVGDAFGWSVAVGEVTGDDTPELMVGAPLHDTSWGAEGALYVYTMDTDGGATVLARRFGEHDYHQLGTGLAAGRDLDGDGVGDLVVGAVAAWHQLRPKSGRTYILAGGSTLTGDSVIGAHAQIHATGAKDYLGRAAAFSDIDADGIADLVVGSAYTNPGGRTDSGSVWLFFGG